MNTNSSFPVQCPVCHQADFREVFACTDFFVTHESFPVLECTCCGFRLTGSAPASEGIGRYYQSEEYVSHSDTRKGFTNKAYHLVRDFMVGRKRKIVCRSSGKQSGSLLDVGAGTGFFLQFMQKKGWEVTGTEKSDDARHFAGHEWNLSLLPDNGLFLLTGHSFDVITMWHVMEHLYRPEIYLAKLSELVIPSGILVIALPNPDSADAEHYRQYWAAWDVPRHLWHFLPENVCQMVEPYGFRLKKTCRMPFDAFYVSILSEKYRGSRFAVLKGFVSGTISWFVSLFRLRKCSSLIYVFKRQ